MPYFTDIAPVIGNNIEVLRATGALAARPGFILDHDGYPTKLRAVVLIADPSVKPTNVPAHIGGFPVDIRTATPAQVLQFKQPATFVAQSLASPEESVPDDFPGLVSLRSDLPLVAQAVPPPGSAGGYTPPADADYRPLDLKDVTIICSCSPDNGWSVLQDFIQGTKMSMTTAMYDFTSAHVEQTVATSLKGKRFKLVIDHPGKNRTADETDEQTVAKLATALGGDLAQAWALTPSDPDGGAAIFQTSYHIKVAVRDAGDDNVGVWISSGNWNNSNQPVFDWENPDKALARKSDRDWHVVVLSKEVAEWFATFIEHDYGVAKAANAQGVVGNALAKPLPPPPVVAATIDEKLEKLVEFVGPVTLKQDLTITPLLTPDVGVYADAIFDLINKAQHTIDLQLQYINSFANDPKYAELIDALGKAQQRNGMTVRVILGNNQQSANLELMQEAGMLVDHDHVRIQPNVHNKGILVDGSRTVVSSQNWSGAGVLRNRDAGVIIESEQVNAYFQSRFNYDWQILATAKPRAPKKTSGSGDGNGDS